MQLIRNLRGRAFIAWLPNGPYITALQGMS